MSKVLYFIDIIYKYTVDYHPQKRMDLSQSVPSFRVWGALHLVAHVISYRRVANVM